MENPLDLTLFYDFAADNHELFESLHANPTCIPIYEIYLSVMRVERYYSAKE